MASPGDQAPAELTALLERMGVPLAVVETKAEGKHVKALTDLAEGRALFEERPIVAWPIHSNASKQVRADTFCDACFAALTSSRLGCDACKDAYYCGDECKQRGAAAHQFLCKRLAALRGFHAAEAMKQEDGTPSPISVESMARCTATIAAKYVSLKRQNPEAGEGELFEYAAHSFNRLLEPPTDITFEDADPAAWAAVVRRLLAEPVTAAVGPRVAEGLLSDETQRTLLGEMTINAQGLYIKPADGQGMGVEAAAVFTLQSCFNHSCCPTARVTYSSNFDIAVEMIRPVKAGEEVTISYLPALALELEPYARRRERLRPYFFICRCTKCRDEEAAEKAQALSGVQ